MNVKQEKIEKNVIKLEIELSPEAFEEAMQKSFKKNAKNFKLNGFRPGKAPRNVVEKVYGEHVFYDDAVNFLVPDAYLKAIEEYAIDPVDRPEYDIVEIGSNKNFVFTATVTVMPEVELGEYKGLEINSVSDIVAEGDIQKELESVADKNSRLISIDDRSVEMGDNVSIDFDGYVDGVQFPGGEAKGYSLVIGSGQFIPGFEEQLIGAELGSDVEVNVTFPEEYHSADLAGREAMFKVKVNEIKFKEVPLIDDEFASDVSEFNTLDEYKADIRSKMEKKAKDTALNQMKNNIIMKAAENAVIEIPEVMIENQIKSRVDSFESNLKKQGFTIEQYCEMTGFSVDKMKEELKPNAENDVKARLVIEKICKVEDIQVNEGQLDNEIEVVAKNYNQTVEAFKAMIGPNDLDYFTDKIKFDNTIEFLFSNAKIV